MNEELHAEIKKISEINHKIHYDYDVKSSAFFSLTNNIKNIEAEFAASKNTILSLRSELENEKKIKDHSVLFKEQIEGQNLYRKNFL